MSNELLQPKPGEMESLMKERVEEGLVSDDVMPWLENAAIVILGIDEDG